MASHPGHRLSYSSCITVHFLPLERIPTQCCPQPGVASGGKPLWASLKFHPAAQPQNQQGIQQSAPCKCKDFLCFFIKFLGYRSSKSIKETESVFTCDKSKNVVKAENKDSPHSLLIQFCSHYCSPVPFRSMCILNEPPSLALAY